MWHNKHTHTQTDPTTVTMVAQRDYRVFHSPFLIRHDLCLAFSVCCFLCFTFLCFTFFMSHVFRSPTFVLQVYHASRFPCLTFLCSAFFMSHFFYMPHVFLLRIFRASRFSSFFQFLTVHAHTLFGDTWHVDALNKRAWSSWSGLFAFLHFLNFCIHLLVYYHVYFSLRFTRKIVCLWVADTNSDPMQRECSKNISLECWRM